MKFFCCCLNYLSISHIILDEDAELDAQPKNHLESISEETKKLLLNKKETVEEYESSSDEDSDKNVKYPNTHIKVEHDTGKITMRSTSRTLSTSTVDNEENDNVVFLGDDKPISFPSMPQRKQGAKKGQQNDKKTQSKPSPKEEKENANGKQELKRGQRSKLKKIKEKYGDQDDEDKAIMMDYLKVRNSFILYNELNTNFTFVCLYNTFCYYLSSPVFGRQERAKESHEEGRRVGAN